ncbi:MAG: DNA helicase [Pseudomonadota bacterium]
MKLSAPIFRLKRHAREHARAEGIPLHAALDRVAVKEGFATWSHLASVWSRQDPADRVWARLSAGDMLLIGARPGQGKTQLGLDMTRAAAKDGRTSYVFTLEYNSCDVGERLVKPDRGKTNQKALPIVDTSNAICADHILERIDKPATPPFALIDYLQILDQKRTHASLDHQVKTLKSFAQSTGAIFVAISQIDRSFDISDKPLPDRSDVRLPNPLDLTLFNRACFLHEGEIQLDGFG